VVLGANEPDNFFQIAGILLNRNLGLVRWLLTTNFADRLYRLDGTNLSIHTDTSMVGLPIIGSYMYDE
jgi:hypothetical protein